jgi:hypothetical protein
MTINASVRRLVRQRAADRCEYCGLSQASYELVTFHVEHVVAKQHGGTDDDGNLCLSCHWCNLFKGPNLSTMEQGELVRLFNPRMDNWDEHFVVIEGQIHGLSEIGTATLRLLNMNDPDRVELRRLSVGE